MNKIKLMIDSASDLTKQEAENLGMIFMPIEVRFGDEEYLDGVNLTAYEFYEKLEKCTSLPQTSQINPFRYEEEFEKIVKDGFDLVVITLSSKLSGTYTNAVSASEKFNGKVRVIDSLNASSGERILGFYALELINKGLTLDEIESELNTAKLKIKVFASLNTLKYLKMGGRISAVTAFAGELLSIKPVVGVIDGEVKMVGKAMGNKKANALLNSLIEKSGSIDFSKPYNLLFTGNDTTLLENYKKESLSIWKKHKQEIDLCPLGSTIGTHVGPGAVGIAFFAN